MIRINLLTKRFPNEPLVKVPKTKVKATKQEINND